MPCSCIKDTKQKFDFHLESLDCKTLIFTDLSNWQEEVPYIIPEKLDIEITLPSGQTRQVSVTPKTTSKISLDDLSLSKKCLPNGIYCFKTESCGYTMTRHKAVVCKLYCKLDNLIAKAQTEEDNAIISELSNLIKSIEINTEIGKHQQAVEIYKIVDKKFSRLHCECPCT